jgi:hypothetical protein
MMNRLGIQYTARGEKALIQTAIGNIAAGTTDGTLTLEGATLAAVTGKRYYVLGVFAHLAGATETNVTLNSKGSGAGTAISSTKQVVANGGWVQTRGTEIDYLYKTKRGEALTVTTGAGSTVGIDLIVLIDD